MRNDERAATVVVVHGGPGFDHTMFKAFYSQLTEIAQLIYYDHRGNGRSEEGPRERWTLDQWADDLNTLCATLGIERPIVFGTSFGGFVALNYAARHPDGASRLIVSSTTAKIHLDRSLAMFERLGGAEVRAVAERFFTEPTKENRDEYQRVCHPHYVQRPLPRALMARVTRRDEVSEHFFRGELRAFDLTPRLDRIRCPVLHLAGELDPIVTNRGLGRPCIRAAGATHEDGPVSWRRAPARDRAARRRARARTRLRA